MSDWLERELARGLAPVAAPEALRIRLGLARAKRRAFPRVALTVAAAVALIIGGSVAAGRTRGARSAQRCRRGRSPRVRRRRTARTLRRWGRTTRSGKRRQAHSSVGAQHFRDARSSLHCSLRSRLPPLSQPLTPPGRGCLKSKTSATVKPEEGIMPETLAATGSDHRPRTFCRRSSLARRALYYHRLTSYILKKTMKPGASSSPRIQPRWERYANPHFLRGVEALEPAPTTASRASPRSTAAFSRSPDFRPSPSAATSPASSSSTASAAANSPPPSPSAPPTAWTTSPSPTSSTTSPATSPCTPRKHFADTLVRFGDCAHHRRSN